MGSPTIHPTAIIAEGAQIGEGAEIGPYCIVGADVTLGEGVVLKSHVVIEGVTTIGARSIIHAFVSLGGAPQHLAHKGEPTRLVIGDDVTIREHVTMNTGTVAGGGVTKVGDRGLFMTGAHVAHDCQVGDDVIFANNATLGGHVSVGNHVFLGGLCAIHQHSRIGNYAFVGGCAAVPNDIIPYASAYGNHARLSGLNVIGMKRRKMDRVTIKTMREGYRYLFESDEGSFRERLDVARERYAGCAEFAEIIAFIDAGEARSLMPTKRA